MVHPTATAIEPHCPGGVIEGFYGPPWSDAERRTLLDWMAGFGLTAYLFCPKDDPHHRATWREPYPPGEAERIARLIADCRKRRIDFIWGVGPGLDLRHAEEADVAALLARFAEPDLHARLLLRMVVGNVIVDLEIITRNFPEGRGTLEMLCVYEVADGRIQKASFLTGEKKLEPAGQAGA